MSVCACMTGSIRTVRAGLIGSNGFLCCDGGVPVVMRGAGEEDYGTTCLAASPKTHSMNGLH